MVKKLGLATALSVLLLSGCGGGGSDVPVETTSATINTPTTTGFKGLVDNSFGNNGYVIDDTIGNSFHSIKSKMIIDNNEDIYVSGTKYDSNTSDDGYITKYTKDGKIDTNFGNSGLLKIANVTHSGDKLDRITNLVTDKENNLYVVGYSENSNSNTNSIFILKFNSKGILDTDFGINGTVLRYLLINGDISDDVTEDVIIDDKGQIYITGFSRSEPNKRYMFILKYNPDGLIDSSLGENGKVLFDNYPNNDSSNFGRTIMLDQSQKFIFVSGITYDTSNNESKAFLLKYDTNGTLENSFGNNGKILIKTIASNYNEAIIKDIKSITKDTDNHIYILGNSSRVNNQNNSDIFITKYNKDGVIDTDFGENGTVILTGMSSDDGYNASDFASDLILDKYNNVYIVGYADNKSNKKDMYIMKLDRDGKIDMSFGKNGKITSTDSNNTVGTSISISNSSLIVSGLKDGSGFKNIIWKYK